MGPADYITAAGSAAEDEDQPGEPAPHFETALATLADMIYKQIKDHDTPVCIDIWSAWQVAHGDQRIRDAINDIDVQHSDADEGVAVLHATTAANVVEDFFADVGNIYTKAATKAVTLLAEQTSKMVLENGSTNQGTSALKRASAEREKIADKLFRSIHTKLELQQTQINENNTAKEKYATIIRNMKSGARHCRPGRYTALHGAHGGEASEELKALPTKMAAASKQTGGLEEMSKQCAPSTAHCREQQRLNFRLWHSFYGTLLDV